MAVPVDLVPAACSVVVPPTLASAGIGDHIIAGDVAGRIVAPVDPATPTAGAHAVAVSLSSQRLSEEVGIGSQLSCTHAYGDAVADDHRPLRLQGSGNMPTSLPCGLAVRLPALAHRTPLQETVGLLAVAKALRDGIPVQRLARVQHRNVTEQSVPRQRHGILKT